MTQTGGPRTDRTRTGETLETSGTREHRVTFDAESDRSRTTIAELVISARYRQVRLARLLAGGVAAQLGLDVDRVENVRLTVDELCAVMLECAVARDATDDHLTVSFELESANGGGAGDSPEHDRAAPPASLVVTVQRRNAVIVDEPSAITASILDSTCSTWSVSGTLVRAALPADSRLDQTRSDEPDDTTSVAADGA